MEMTVRSRVPALVGAWDRRAFARQVPSGEVYVLVDAAEDSDTIVALSDALHHREYRDEDGSLRSWEGIEVRDEDADWANRQTWEVIAQ